MSSSTSAHLGTPESPRTPVAAQVSRTWKTLINGTTIWLAFAALAATWSVFVPKFEEIFVDFGVSLPLISRLVIQAGRFCASGIGMASLLILLFFVLAPIAWASSKTWRATAALAILAGICWSITLLLMLVGMFVPLTMMIKSLQGG